MTPTDLPAHAVDASRRRAAHADEKSEFVRHGRLGERVEGAALIGDRQVGETVSLAPLDGELGVGPIHQIDPDVAAEKFCDRPHDVHVEALGFAPVEITERAVVAVADEAQRRLTGCLPGQPEERDSGQDNGQDNGDVPGTRGR